MAKYEEKFIVFHVKELECLTDEGRNEFSSVMKAIQLSRITKGKNPLNNYYVCNQDEPYAQKVFDIILEGERIKEVNNVIAESIDSLQSMSNYLHENNFVNIGKTLSNIADDLKRQIKE